MTVKSPCFSPGIGRPCLSVTTTSTCTRRVVLRNTGLVGAPSATGGACCRRDSGTAAEGATAFAATIALVEDATAVGTVAEDGEFPADDVTSLGAVAACAVW